jgi:catechol 2,3-dioxygenase-like lactoylglutathione lyase family enzyme
MTQINREGYAMHFHHTRSVSKRLFLAAGALILAAGYLRAQESAPPRPLITGISHTGYFVTDLPKAIGFWHDLLGFDEYNTLNRPGTNEIRIAFIKINDRQHVELFTDAPKSPPNMMSHLCFSVSDVEQMRAYLRAKGIDVKAGGGKTRTGDYAFEIKDPDGTLIEFVQSLPDGIEALAAGRFMPSTRIADSIYHAGFLVGNPDKSLTFYEGILGFTETWRGSSDGKELSWVNLKVPDGKDYIELMLYDKLPATFGGKNHLSLVVPDLQKAIAELESRPAYKTYLTYAKPPEMQVGKNGKRQVNLYDPDGTRVELMEAHTADGKPVPPSTAPPPPPAHN